MEINERVWLQRAIGNLRIMSQRIGEARANEPPTDALIPGHGMVMSARNVGCVIPNIVAVEVCDAAIRAITDHAEVRGITLEAPGDE